VRLHRLDENSASEVSGLLGELRQLQRAWGTAIVLVHHARKSLGGRPGQGLRGSSDLWAWGDSNAYLTRRNGSLTLTLEHRHLPAPLPIALELRCDGAARLEVVDGKREDLEPLSSSLDQRLLAALRGDMPLTRTALRARLRVQNQRLGAALRRLEEAGLVRRTRDGWQQAPTRRCSVPTTRESTGTERPTPSDQDQP
jgi:hypothetical protein